MKVHLPEEKWDIQPLVVVIYGDPGVGKTTLAATAENPIIFDFDYGAHRSGKKVKTIRFDGWGEMYKNWQEIKNILASHKTLIIDTVDTLLESIQAYIIENNPRLEKNALKRFGELRNEFSTWVQQIRILQKDLILLSHCKEKEEGDIRVKRLAIPGQSYDRVMQLSDFVGYYSIVNQKRVVDFNPTDITVGKNPVNTPPIYIPDVNEKPNFFANIIESWKKTLFTNITSSIPTTKITEETDFNPTQVETEYRNFETVIQFNIELEKLKKSGDIASKKKWDILKAVAKEQGLTYDTAKKEFVR